MRVRLPSWIYTNNAAPDVRTGSKNIAERAENRNRLGSASNKDCVGKCNLGSMEEGRDFGPLTMYVMVERLFQQL